MASKTTALVISLTGALLLGCEGSGQQPAGTGSPAATTAAATAKVSAAASVATAPATATATTTVSADAKAEPPVYPPHKVKQGMNAGVYVGPFEIVRDKGSVGVPYLDAMKRCLASNQTLCTDMQWARACEADPELAKIETWTVSGVGMNKFVVRGGEAGCRSRDVSEGTERVPGRAAVCCDPVIGVKTSRAMDAVLSSAVKNIVKYQGALRARDTLALSGLYDDKVMFLGKQNTNADLMKMHDESFKKDPDQWTVFDTCSISIEGGADGGAADGGAEAKVTTDCNTLYQRNGSVVVAMQRLIWGGPSMKIQIIGDAVTARQSAPDGTVVQEGKVRVGILLVSD